MNRFETIARRVEQLEEPEHEGKSVCGECGEFTVHLNPNVDASITVCPDCITEHLESVELKA